MPMSDAFGPAIEALKLKLAKDEQNLSETRSLINKLCEAAGRPKLYPDPDMPLMIVINSIPPDASYGKKLCTALREYLDMPQALTKGAISRFEISV